MGFQLFGVGRQDDELAPGMGPVDRLRSSCLAPAAWYRPGRSWRVTVRAWPSAANLSFQRVAFELVVQLRRRARGPIGRMTRTQFGNGVAAGGSRSNRARSPSGSTS